ncbi:MAG: TIGR00341 family protein [Phycisphaerales bacterium]
MPLRVLQIVLPVDDHDELCSLLDTAHCDQRWVTPLDNDFSLTSVIVRSENVEPITDTLREHYDHTEGFRTVLHDIQATYPALEESEAEKAKLAELENKEASKQSTWRTRFGRISREELREDIEDSSKITPVFITMVVLATIVASVGLLKDSPAIIIGAMVIAPLLGPNTALALGTTLGDLKMIRSAIKSNTLGLMITIVIATVVGFFLDLDPINNEMSTRTAVDAGDIILALASGAAGVVAFTTGASSTLVGVMVAVAIMPPTVTCGMLIGTGNYTLAGGAATLAITNIVCINLSSASILLAQGVRPNTWWDKGRAKKATRTALIFWTLALSALGVIVVYFWH